MYSLSRAPRLEAIAVGYERTPSGLLSPTGDSTPAHGDGFEPWESCSRPRLETIAVGYGRGPRVSKPSPWATNERPSGF